MGLSHCHMGAIFFNIGPMGIFVFFALGCLGGEVQIAPCLCYIRCTSKSADSLVANKNRGVFLSRDLVTVK